MELKDIINKQFEIAGHDMTYEKALEDPEWYYKYTITEEQEKEFKRFLIKDAKVKKHKVGMFLLMYGLRTV